MVSKKIILSTAADPLHEGHLFLLRETIKLFPKRHAIIEVSFNVDKYIEGEEVQRRVNNISGCGFDVYSSSKKTFVHKSEYMDTIFSIGSDTAERICDIKYYYNSQEHMEHCLGLIIDRSCKFCVFTRNGDSFTAPEKFTKLFYMADAIPPDVSSTELRILKGFDNED